MFKKLCNKIDYFSISTDEQIDSCYCNWQKRDSRPLTLRDYGRVLLSRAPGHGCLSTTCEQNNRFSCTYNFIFIISSGLSFRFSFDHRIKSWTSLQILCFWSLKWTGDLISIIWNKNKIFYDENKPSIDSILASTHGPQEQIYILVIRTHQKILTTLKMDVLYIAVAVLKHLYLSLSLIFCTVLFLLFITFFMTFKNPR